MAWADHVHFYLDSSTFGGVVSERLLAAIVLAEGLYCGLVFSFGSTGAPTVEFWERIDDLERSGFASIPLAKARAISDALPRFLEQLEQAQQEAHRAQLAAALPPTLPVQPRWSAYDPAPDPSEGAFPPEWESRAERQKRNVARPDAYEGG